MLNQTGGAPAQISTVKDKYEETKDGTNKALRDAKEPLDPKDAGEVKSELPNDGDDFKESIGSTDSIYSLGGLNSLPVDGCEGFVENAKAAVEWLWKRAVDIFNLIADYVYNRVSNIRRRITRLKHSFNDNGVSLKDAKYPASVVRLTSNPTVPRTPNFAIKSLEQAQEMYKKVMKQQDQINNLTRPLPPETTREQLLNFSESLSNSYVSALGGNKVKDHVYEVDMPTGFQVMKATSNRARGFNGFGLSEFFRPKIKVNIPESFIVSADVVQSILLKADVLLMDVEKVHKSQRSFSNKFKRSVDPLVSSVKNYPEKTREEITKFYRWLVNYQHRTISIPLNYYLSVISASIDLAKAQVHQK
ncbi:hypothetical protein [Vibrio phage phiKT1028]|nr:hypothetical protein [Vibrio phage phiKT1028]